MIPLKPILLAVGKCLLVYAVLLLLYSIPAVHQAFSSYVRVVGKVSTFAWDTKWEDNSAAMDEKKDIMVRLIHKRNGQKVQTSQSVQSWKTFFMPFAILLALILGYSSTKRGLLKTLLLLSLIHI